MQIIQAMPSQVGSASSQQMPLYCLRWCDQACISASLSFQYTLSVLFTLATLLVSAYHIYMHLHNFNNPFFQSKIIVILIMAPFYCLTSLGSFVWPYMEAYFTLTRDVYESILLFTFFYLIFSYLAYDRERNTIEDKKVYVIMITHEREIPHFFPFHYCQKPYQLTHWKKGKYFTYRCKKYVLQFLVVKIFTTLLMYVVYPNQELKMEEEGAEPQDHATYLFVSSCVSWIVGISASYSLYYLVLFYHSLHKPLAPYSPLLKFLTIKITLFFTFWQKIMIAIFEEDFLACFDHTASNYQHRTIITSLQNTLICFEMLIMAVAGGLAYNYQNYVSPLGSKTGNLSEVLRDTARAFQNDFRLIKPKKFGFEAGRKDEIELQALSSSAPRESTACKINVKQSLHEAMICDYL